MERRPLYLLRQARGLLSLSLILGATWFIGVANTFLQYMPLTFIFTILNSLQGTVYKLGQRLLPVLPNWFIGHLGRATSNYFIRKSYSYKSLMTLEGRF